MFFPFNPIKAYVYRGFPIAMFDYRRVVLQSSMIVAVSGNAGGAIFALPHLRLCHYWRCLHGAPSPVLGKIPWFVIILPFKVAVTWNAHLRHWTPGRGRSTDTTRSKGWGSTTVWSGALSKHDWAMASSSLCERSSSGSRSPQEPPGGPGLQQLPSRLRQTRWKLLV